jgi:transposase
LRLADEIVTEVRQRAACQRHGRCGVKAGPVWAHRRMLLTAGKRLTHRQLARLRTVLVDDDPTNEIGAAWGCKELLLQLLRFYDACPRRLGRDYPPGHHHRDLGPAIQVALTEQVTNARTKGFDRIIKQVKGVGYGFTNVDNYLRRIMAHIAVIRSRGQAE